MSQQGLVKTKLFCDDMWEGGMVIELPPQRSGQRLFLDMTVPSFGALEGWFDVVDVEQRYLADHGGYRQHVYIDPSSNQGY